MGVFTTWHKVPSLVRDYPGVIHKLFCPDEDAHTWLAEQLDPMDLTNDDDETFTTCCVEPAGHTSVVTPVIGGAGSEGLDQLPRKLSRMSSKCHYNWI
jgi:hypothetical protein